MNRILLIARLSLFFFVFSSFKTDEGKQGKEDLVKMNMKYGQSKSMSMHIAVKVFENKSQASDPTVYSGIMKKSKEGYYSSLKGLTTLMNDHCSLLVDDNQKLIVYGTGSAKNMNAFQEKDIAPMLDSMLYKNNKVELKSSGAGSKVYQITTGTGSFYEKMEVRLGVPNYTLDEIIYYYKTTEEAPGSKVVVSYSSVNLDAPLSSSDFSEKKFVEKKGSRFVGIGKYAGYKIIDSSKNVSVK
ncbi:MAG TPA: hypothetical protein VNZ86_01100 [Bacteroidia bacterium]|jgi:hypothetical protein|nr:hypothetical protein [Bacteroidia bacterium]